MVAGVEKFAVGLKRKRGEEGDKIRAKRKTKREVNEV